MTSSAAFPLPEREGPGVGRGNALAAPTHSVTRCARATSPCQGEVKGQRT